MESPDPERVLRVLIARFFVNIAESSNEITHRSIQVAKWCIRPYYEEIMELDYQEPVTKLHHDMPAAYPREARMQHNLTEDAAYRRELMQDKAEDHLGAQNVEDAAYEREVLLDNAAISGRDFNKVESAKDASGGTLGETKNLE